MGSMGGTQLNPLPPILSVLINGHREDIDTGNIAGDGGEAIVVRHKKWAVKILHPSPKIRTPWRIRKLEEQIQRKPPTGQRTVRPMYPVTDAKTHLTIGLAMELLDMSKYETLTWWMNKQHRQDQKITFQDICSIFLEIKDELDTNHAAGYVIGDFNPGGILVLKKQYWDQSNENDRVRMVDADSLEFDTFPCYVYSLNWLDYKLVTEVQNIGTRTGIYTKLSDYFSFDALFFQALTNAGVYAGNHDLFTGIKRWMAKQLTVLHPEVEYPDDAVPLDTLPPPFQKHFRDSFVKGVREPFPLDALRMALGLQISLQPRQQSIPINTANMIVEILSNQLEGILDYTVSGETIHILSSGLEGGFFYTVIFDGSVRVYPVPDTREFARYRILTNGWVIEMLDRHPGANQATVRIIHVTESRPHWEEKITQAGINGEPLIGGGAGNLFSVANNYLGWQDLENASKKNMLHAANTYTELRCDQVTGNTVGMTRIGNHFTWFFTRGNVSYDTQIATLDDTETINDWDMIYAPDGRSVLIVRSTQFQGASFTRFDEVNLSSACDDDKRLMISEDGRREDGELFTPLRGAVYMRQNNEAVILYATNNGITRFNLVNGQVNVFEATKGVVRNGDGLRLYKSSLVAVGDGRAVVISLR